MVMNRISSFSLLLFIMVLNLGKRDVSDVFAVVLMNCTSWVGLDKKTKKKSMNQCSFNDDGLKLLVM